LSDVLKRVAVRLEELLAASKFPVGLKVDGWYDDTGRMVGAVWFRIRSSGTVVGVHDYSEVFAELGRVLTAEFGTELGASIAIEAPAELCGPAAVLRRAESNELKSEFGKARWKDIRHG
jgi:hypothetical protein